MEQNYSKKIFCLVMASLLLVMSFSMSGCIEEDEDTTLVIAQTSEPANWNPITYTDVFAGYVLTQIYDPLVQTYPEGEVNADGRSVAESFEISDDGHLYTFELEKGVMFHNGEEMTAHDIEFTLNTVKGVSEELYDVEGAPESPREGDLSAVSNIEATDDYRLEIQMEERDGEFLQKGVFTMMCIVPKGYIVENGWDAYEDELIGTGPYQFVEYSPGDEIVIEAFDDYREDVNIPRVRFNFFDSESSAITALRDGRVHFMAEMGVRNFHDLREEDSDEVITKSYPLVGHFSISFNHRDGPFTDEKVRKAFAYAIDSDEVIDAIRTPELAYNTRSPFPDIHPAYPEDLKQYDQDIEKAQELLAEAGYPDGLETQLYTSEGDSEDEMIVVQGQVAEAGFDLEVIALEWGSFINELEAGNAPLHYAGWTGGASAQFTMAYLEAESPWSYYSGFYNSTAFTEKIREAERTVGEERWELYHEAQRIMVEEEMGWYGMYTREDPSAYYHTLNIPEEAWTPYMAGGGGGPIYELYLWEMEA